MRERHVPGVARRGLLLASGLACLAPRLSRAQSGRPLRLVVPFTPGGSTDILARALAGPLAASMGQHVVVENRPGAGGSIGAGEVARAEPDGNTVLMGHIGTLAVNPAVYEKLPYDPVKSFAPVAFVARVPNVLVVHAAKGAADFRSFIAQVKAAPGRLSFSSGGNGSAAHITFESLKLEAGLFLLHLPYRGTAPSVTDLIAGQVDATFTGSPAVLPHIRAGRLRALAVSSMRRLPVLPDVPTIAESGYPGFEADQWYGIVAPVGTPPARVERLNALVNRVLGLPEIGQQLAMEGAEPVLSSPEAFGQLIAREIPRWARVVKAGHVKPG